MVAWSGQAGTNGWFDYKETDPGQPDNEYISNWGVSSSAPIFPANGDSIAIGSGYIATGGYGSFNNLSLSGSLTTAYGQSFTVAGVLANTGTLTIYPSAFTVGPGTQTNSGTINVVGGGGGTGFNTALAIAGSDTFQGGGSIVLSTDYWAGTIINANDQNATFLNADNTISGVGQIASSRSGGILTFINDGTVDANDAKSQLAIYADTTNNGQILATGAGGTGLLASGGLLVQGATIDNTNGTMKAQAGSRIQLIGAVIKGGISSAAGGEVLLFSNADADTSSTFDGSASTFSLRGTVDSYVGLHLKGAINNAGAINVDGSAMILDTPQVTLSGNGKIVLSNTTIRSVAGQNTTLTNNGNTISGSGVISNYDDTETLTFVNKGIVDATDATNRLDLGNGRSQARKLAIRNTGLIEATGAGGLGFVNATLNNIGGTVRADNGSHIDLNDVILRGGITSRGSGYFDVAGNAADTSVYLDGRSSAFSSSATIDVSSGILHVQGTLANTGTLNFNNATMELETTAVMLSGAGHIVLSGSTIGTAQGQSTTFTNAGNAISGYGTISSTGNGETLTFVNKSTVDANSSGNQLTLGYNDTTIVRNYGLLEATAGGVLQINGTLRNIGIIQGVIATNGSATTVTADTAGQLHLTGGTGDNQFVVRSAPTRVDGGSGRDMLELAATVKIAAGSVVNVETIQVDDGVTANLSRLTTGETIKLLSRAGSMSTVFGTQGNDKIYAGAGADVITGGTGNDLLTAGTGADTFNEQMAGFGRDAVYNANMRIDTFDVAGLAASRSDLVFTAIDKGADILVTGAHSQAGDGLVLKGISLSAAQHGHYTFDASPTAAHAMRM